MAHLVRRTVTIGLGGTGLAAVLNVKRRLYRIYGEIPDTFKFLVLDTTTPKESMEKGKVVRLEPAEFVQLSVKRPRSVIKSNKEVRDWWTEVPPGVLDSITAGAGQMRPLGRLALFSNPNRVVSKLRKVMQDVGAITTGRLGDKYRLAANNVIVSVVGSVAGGTGSGTLLDVGFILRDSSSMKPDDKLNAYILLPDIFVGRTATKFVEPNAYGAIKELDYILSRPEDAESENYKLGGEEIKVEGSVFNVVALVNNMNRSGQTVEQISDLTEFLGTVIFLSTGSTGDANSDIFDNLEKAIAVQGDWYGKKANYCSYGVSEIVFPREETCNFLRNKISLSILDQLILGGKASEIGKDVEDLIDKLGIREDSDDRVINAICMPTDCPRFPDPGELKKGQEYSTSSTYRTNHIDKAMKQIAQLASDNCAAFTVEKLALLDAENKEFLLRPGGLAYSKVLHDSLLGRVVEFQNEMKSEKKSEAAKAEVFRAKYKGLKDDFDRAGKKFVGRAKALDKVKAQFKALVDAECRSLLEIERRTLAIEFFATFIMDIKSTIATLRKIADYGATLMQTLNEEIQSVETSRSRMRPFTFELPISDIIDPKDALASADQFLGWLASEKEMHLLDLGAMKLLDIRAIFDDFSNQQPAVAETANMTIEDVLKDMPVERRNKIVAEIDGMAVPLWNYDQGMVTGGKTTENVFIFGVPDALNTVFVADDLLSQLKGADSAPTLASTGDPLRVVCFKAEAALPAHLINSFGRYREKFVKGHMNLSFHISSRWEEICPDLFPGTDEDDNRPYWSLALADTPFGLIKRTGAFYRIFSKAIGKKVDDFMVDLGSGRPAAMKAFLADEELVAETKKNVEAKVRQIGEGKAATELEVYVDGLMAEVRKGGQKKEIRAQIEKELGDIESFIEDLRSIR